MKIIGLTGGIGTGKSTVSDYLRKKGCIIIDADAVSREMTAPGGIALPEIREKFGDEYFDEEGNLLRRKMADLVFSNPEKKKLLESIVTDRVLDRITEFAARYRNCDEPGIAVVDAPLLFEGGADALTDSVWLVTAEMNVRIERVLKRDNTDRASVEARIANQMDEDEKIRRSDVIIDNSSDLKHLYVQLDRLIERENLSDETN